MTERISELQAGETEAPFNFSYLYKGVDQALGLPLEELPQSPAAESVTVPPADSTDNYLNGYFRAPTQTNALSADETLSRLVDNPNRHRKRGGISYIAIGVTACVAVVGGVYAAGGLSSNHESSLAVIPGTSQSPSAGNIFGPNALEPTITPTPTESPKSYNLSFIGFGNTNNGCRSLATSATKATTLVFTLRGHTHTVNMPATNYELLTCGQFIQFAAHPNGVDQKLNTEKQVALINRDSMSFKVNGPTTQTIDTSYAIGSIFPAQIMQAKIPTVCDTYKLVGCPNVPIPADYLLSTAEVALYKYSAAELALNAIQNKCAKVEYNTEAKALLLALETQAINQGVDRAVLTSNVITEKFVNTQGKVLRDVPRYDTAALDQLVKAGAVTAAAKLFTTSTIPTTCTPITLKAAA